MSETTSDRDKRPDDGRIIRREVRLGDVRLRSQEIREEHLRAAKRTLRDIHRLETMAVEVYRAQWSPAPTELNRQLIAAMENERAHQTDSLARLMEFGGKPTPLRLPFYIAGRVMGRVSRVLGFRTMMRLGMWVEGKAIEHYHHLAAAMEWDAEVHPLVKQMWEDEEAHYARWRYYLEHPEEALAPPQRQFTPDD